MLTAEQTAEVAKQVAEALKADKDKNAKEVRKFTPGAGQDEGEYKPEADGHFVDEVDQPFSNLGEMLLAVKRAGAEGTPIRDPRLKRCIGDDYEWTTKGGKTVGKAISLDKNGRTKAPSGMGESVPSDGAFLVAQEFIPTLYDRIYNTGIVFSKCYKQAVGANFNGFKIPAIDETSRVDGSRWGGIQAYWGAEAATITSSKPKIRQISVTLEKLFALCYVTDELLEDSVALEGYVNRWFPMELGFKLDDAIINGDGAGKPLGLLNAPGRVTVSKETNQPAATINTQNIFKMFKRVWQPSWPNVVWFINQEILDQLMTLIIPIGTAGAVIPLYYAPGTVPTSGNAYGADYGRMLGKPVIPIEQCAALGTEGDIIAADLTQYIVGDKGGMNASSSIHVQFVTDQTAFRWIYRVNGEPVWHQPLTPYKGSSTLSPYVTLQTRS